MSSYRQHSGGQLFFFRGRSCLHSKQWDEPALFTPYPRSWGRGDEAAEPGQRRRLDLRLSGGNTSPRFPRLSWEMLTVWPTRRTSWLPLWGPTGHSGRAVYCVSLKLGSPRTHRTLMWMYLDSRRWERTGTVDAAAKAKVGDSHCLLTTDGAARGMLRWRRPSATETLSCWR